MNTVMQASQFQIESKYALEKHDNKVTQGMSLKAKQPELLQMVTYRRNQKQCFPLLCLQSWTELLAPLINMNKEACENKSVLLILSLDLSFIQKKTEPFNK